MTTGTFQASVEKEFGKITKSQNKGTLGLEVTLTLIEGPDKGTVMKWTGWITDGAAAKTADTIANCFGWDRDSEEFYCGPGHHQKCLAVIKERTSDQGKTFYEVAFINPLGQAASGDDKKEALKKLRGLFGLSSSSSSSVKSADLSEDEIPF